LDFIKYREINGILVI